MSNQQQAYAPVGADFLQGFTRVSRPDDSRLLTEAQRQAQRVHEARVASAAEFMADLLRGRLRSYYLREMLRPSSPEIARVIESNYPGLIRPLYPHERVMASYQVGMEITEAMTTSDFPLLVGDVLDRMLLARFREKPQVWRGYIDVGTPLRDFRLTRILQTDGGDGQWAEITDEDGITYTSLTESGKTLTGALYGKAIRLSWRLILNDDLDAFMEIPAILGRGGRRTVHKFATDLVFNSTGPDTSVVTAITGTNPALTVASLGTAIQDLASQVDSEGEPILMEGIRLVHGPGLRVTVQNIMNQLSVDMNEAGGSANQRVRTNNWLVQGLTAIEDPYIPIICTTNGATSWIVTADPNVGRPVARVRFLQGFEEPQLYQKAPDTMRVSGGLDESVGDFQTMSQEYKGLVAFGGTAIEQKAAVGSNGSGS